MKIMRGLHLLLPLHQPTPPSQGHQHLCPSHAAPPPDELLHHSYRQGHQHLNHSHQAHPPPHLILMCLKKAVQKERGKHYRSQQDLSVVGVGLPLPLQETKSSRGTTERRRTTNLTHPDSCQPGPQDPPLIQQHHGLPSHCSSFFLVHLWSGQ